MTEAHRAEWTICVKVGLIDPLHDGKEGNSICRPVGSCSNDAILSALLFKGWYVYTEISQEVCSGFREHYLQGFYMGLAVHSEYSIKTLTWTSYLLSDPGKMLSRASVWPQGVCQFIFKHDWQLKEHSSLFYPLKVYDKIKPLHTALGIFLIIINSDCLKVSASDSVASCKSGSKCQSIFTNCACFCQWEAQIVALKTLVSLQRQTLRKRLMLPQRQKQHLCVSLQNNQTPLWKNWDFTENSICLSPQLCQLVKFIIAWLWIVKGLV